MVTNEKTYETLRLLMKITFKLKNNVKSVLIDSYLSREKIVTQLN